MLIAGRNSPRPGLTTALGWLSVAWGIFVLIASLYGSRALFAPGELREQRSSAFVVAASLILIGLLWLLSGAGILSGRRWGWWLFGIHAVLGVIRHGGALVHLVASGVESAVATPFDASVRLVGFAAFLAFWNSAELRRWCDVESVSRWRALGLVGAAVCAIVAVFWLPQALAS